MSGRERLPNRRETLMREFEHSNHRFLGAVSFYEDGRPAEIFLNSCGPVGSAISFVSLEAGITASLYLQRGGTIEELSSALPKLHDNSPSTPLGVFLSMVKEELNAPQSSLDTAPRAVP